MKRLIYIAAAAAVVLGAAVAVVGALWYQDNRKPNFNKSYDLYVYPQTSASDVVDSLVANDVVINLKSLDRTFKKENVAGGIKPGHYVVSPSSPSIYVARMLTRGWQTPVNLTLSGALRSKDRIATQISNQMMLGYDEVYSAMYDKEFLAKYETDTLNLFGFFLPDSYQMYWTSSVDDIFGRFKKEYDAFWTSDRQAKADALGLTRNQVSTLASIVSGETRAEKEFSKIAGVYLNRFKIGMRLQADPTVCYCYGYTLNRVLLKHLEIDSPYNTYKYAGLPPGPICTPGKAYLDAVLNPDKHGYMYFCASSSFDGTHDFAVTYDEHLRNARKFQAALTARNKARQ